MKHIAYTADNAYTLYMERLTYTNLYVVQCGIGGAHKSEMIPRVYNNMLIHVVYEGEGTYTHMDFTSHVKAGEAFLIFPGDTVFYAAENDMTWRYRWVEIGGDMEKLLQKIGITRENRILKNTGNMHETLRKLVDAVYENRSVYDVTGCLWQFIHSIAESSGEFSADPSPQASRVRTAREIIQKDCGKKLSVLDVANRLGINRTYLNKLFQQYEGMSAQQYIMQCCMKNAVNLLKNRKFSIADVSRYVGYPDQLVFSKAFHRFYGMSPSAWRQKEFEKQIY